MNVANLIVTIGADTAMAQQGIMGIVQLLGKGGVLGLAAGGAVLAVGGIAIAATKMAADFQTGLTQLVTGAGESQSNLKLVSDGILQMARDTGTSTDQLTSGMYMIESAGYHGAAGLKILQAAAEGAKVGNADLGTVADAVTTVMKDYSASGVTATQATNELIATVANGKTHMADLASALAGILPTASAAGVGLNDVMGAMATMTGEGVPAAEATTYLRQLLLNLNAPSSQAAKALESVGLTTDQVSAAMKKSLPDALKLITDAVGKKFPAGSAEYVAAIKDISGGTRNIQAMLDLTGTHLKDFQANVGNVTSAVTKGGNSITGWSLVQGTFNQQMARLGEVFQTVMIQLGQKFLPVATAVAGFFADNLPRALGMLGPIFDTIGGIIAQVTGALGAMTNASTTLLVPVQALSGTAKDAGAAFQGIATAIAPAHKAVSDTGTALRPLSDALKETGKSLGTTVLPIVRDLGTVFVTQVLPAVRQVAPIFEKLGQVVLTQLAPALVPLIGNIVRVVAVVGGAYLLFEAKLLPILIKVGGWIATGLTQAITFLAPKIADAAKVVGKFADDLSVRLGPAINNIATFITVAMTIIQTLWNAAWPAISFVLKSVWGEIEGVIQIAWSLISGIIKVGLDVLGGNWGQAWKDLQDMLRGVWDGIVKVLQSGIGNVLGLIGNLLGTLLGKLGDLKDAAIQKAIDLGVGFYNALTSLPGKLLTLGVTLMQQLGQGIKNGIGHVTDAVKNIPLVGGATADLAKLIPGFATGGTMPATGLAMVGEAGPELVRLPGGAQVTPLSKLGAGGPISGLPAGLASGVSGASATTQTIVIQLDGKTLARAAVRHLPSEIRLATGSRSL